MGTRCTPFGLFAGCSLGDIGPATAIDFTNRRITQHNWLDIQVLLLLAQHKNQQPELQDQLRYWPNSSLYRIGQQLRYTEIASAGGSMRYFLSQLEAKPAIRRVLHTARQGATIKQLTDQLCQRNYPAEEAQAFINALILDQILVSELHPNVTGQDFLAVLINKLNQIPGGQEFALPLQEIHSLLRQTARASPTLIRHIIEQQMGLPLPHTDVLQCDSFHQGIANQLSQSALYQLKQSVTMLTQLSRSTVTDEFNAFKSRFYARYEEREISLAIALDGETGVGYGVNQTLGSNSLIQDLLPPETHSLPIGLSDRGQQRLLQLYSDWQLQGGLIALTQDDILQLGETNPNPQLPDSYYALGYFLADSGAAIDRGQFRFVLKGLGGPTAFPLMGRFCRDDVSLTQRVRVYFDQAQQQDANRIYAEVAHLPMDRSGNVVQRPHLRAYEIPYLVHSLLPPDQQIRLDDLFISVPQGQRVVLRSNRLGKEVLPWLTTAHNYSTGLPIYRFLGDLQFQDQPPLISWQWGSLAGVRRLPRVQYNEVILQEARWRLEATDQVIGLSDALTVLDWRQRWQIPRWVALVQGDHELFLDLDVPSCQELLLVSLHQQQTLTLIEWLRTPDQCWINGPGGKMTHEVVIPFSSLPTSSVPVQPAPAAPSILAPVQRTFLPGSEWVYLKIYGGPQTTNQLVKKLGRIARQQKRLGVVTHWFFIRYQDPESHLRIRFHLSDVRHYSGLLTHCERAVKPLSNTDEVHRMQVDTYKRELERYQADLIHEIEWLFWADSEAVWGVYGQQVTDDDLLAAAILGIDAYLTDFGLSTSHKAQYCQQTFTALLQTQSDPRAQRGLLAQKYRVNQLMVTRLLKRESLSATEHYWIRLFKQRSRRGKPYQMAVVTLSTPSADHLSSLIHLSMNRLFSHHPRTYELLVYHHVARAYRSLVAYPF